MNRASRLQLLGLFTVVLVGAGLRLVPHPSNFSPITAMALFGGAYFARNLGKGWALALPVAALFLSDLVLGFHSLMPAVYGSFMMVALLGMALGPKPSALRVGLASVSGSILFFVITNLAMWWTAGMYEKTSAGLVQCFVMALPFFQQALAGDLVYSAVLFGGWALATKALPQLRVA